MKLHILLLSVLVSTIKAQGDGNENENPSVEIQSCDALSCIDTNTGVCQTGQQRAIGVGIAGEVISSNEKDQSLSLTLVDGNPSGVIGDSRGYQFSTQTLYVGLSQSLNPQDQPLGCALMAQYQGSTFPDIDNDIMSNTTACGNIIPETCRRNLVDIIREFNFIGGNETDQQVNQCEALTQYVSMNIRRELTFCTFWLAGFTNVTGGTIFGPDAAEEAAELQQDGCQPVLPEQRSLYKVAEMTQLLYAGDEESLRPAGEDGDDTLPRMAAGRSGITPVMTVLYGDDDDGPDVQFACMRTFAADGGGELPDTLNYESGVASRPVSLWLSFAVVAVSVYCSIM